MRMVALIALRRDDEALQVLDHAAPKTGFDEHFAEYRLALLNAVELARPLLPSEILAVGAPTDQVSPMTTVASCVMGRVLVDRQSGRDQLAVTEAYHLLLLGRCYRLHAYSVEDPVFAKSIEDLAIQEVKILPVSGTRPRFARIPPPSLLLSKDDNLAGLAAECGRPVIAREVVAEATALRGQPDLLRQSLRHVPGGGWACAAALQERWGRMLLRTLPACLVLLLCAAAAGRHWRCADATAARSRIQGAVLGGLTLLFLAAGDLGRCWRTQIDALGLISPPYFAKAHGLYALMPMLTAGSIAGVFVLLSLARAHRSQKPVPTIRPWLVTLPSPLALPQFESRPLVRFIALITIWTALICAFFFVCLDGNAVPLGRDDWLFRYADFLALGIWTIFLAWALHDWFHLPDPPGALGQVWRSLRELTAGYLLAALVIYPVTALLILPVDREFEVTYRRAIHTGEAATVRRELGL